MSLDSGAALQSGGRGLSRASIFDSDLIYLSTCVFSLAYKNVALSDVVRSTDAVHLCEP